MTDEQAEALRGMLRALDAKLDGLRAEIEGGFGAPEGCVTVRERLASLEGAPTGPGADPGGPRFLFD